MGALRCFCGLVSIARAAVRDVRSSATVLRSLLVSLFRVLAGVYFRDVEVVGAPPPGTRGRLFAANHVNGLIDPILVVTSASFPIAPVAKAPLFRVPVLRALLKAVDAVPVVRKQDAPGRDASSNEETFRKIAAHFGRGGNVLIFPEGVSHDEPHVVPLKTGAARMLERARANGASGLSFQAVALEFDARDTFRSRALVLFGPVRAVDELGLEGDGLVARITDTMREDLSALVVEGRTWPERRLIARVAELLAHDAGDRSLSSWSTIGRQVEAARKMVGDGVVSEVDGPVTDYYALLERHGVLEDDVVAGLPQRPGATTRALALLAALPLALMGALLYFPPYQAPKLARRFAGEEQDVVSTYKLAIGLVVHPLWMIALVTVAMVVLPSPWRFVAALVVVTSPFAALAWLDRQATLGARLRAMSASRLAELRAARTRAVEAIARARAHTGV